MTRIRFLLRFGLLMAVALLLVLPASAISTQNEETDLTLTLISPGEGEYFYSAARSYIVAVPVTGQVIAGTVPAQATVVLEVWSDGQQQAKLTTQTDELGFFDFHLDLNPHGSELNYPKLVGTCGECHYRAEAALPAGQVRLVVTATMASGQQATTERQVTVDRAGFATLPVQVALEDGDQQQISGLTVEAATRLYDWRGRSYAVTTDANGVAWLEVEALAESPTHYLIDAPEMQLGNVRYRAVAPVAIELPPGTLRSDTVQLLVRAELGSIDGQIIAPFHGSGAGLTVRAVSWPSGDARLTTTAQDGSFHFPELPLSQYLLSVDLPVKDWVNLEVVPVSVDLRDRPAAETQLALVAHEAMVIDGQIVNRNGTPIPFAWLQQPGGTILGAPSPVDGRFSVTAPPGDRVAMSVTAPGHWSRTVALSTDEPQTITLTARDDLQVIDWGAGELLLPSETVAKVGERTVDISRGWIWGQNGQAFPLTIELPGASLALEAAEFALEVVPEGVSWLYLTDGQATLELERGETLLITAGEMVAVGEMIEAPSIVPADWAIIAMLRAHDQPVAPLPYQAEPSLAARIENGIAKMGVGTAQFLVLGTYAAALLLLIFVPLYALAKWLRRRA